MAWLRLLGGLVALLVSVCAPSHALATNPPEVDRAISWLNSQVQVDGSFAAESNSIATPFQVRVESFAVLKQLSSAPTGTANLIAAESTDAVEYLARQLQALSLAGGDVSAQLLARGAIQNSDGGFGAAAGYPSNPLDTSYVLLALKSASPSSGLAPGAVAALAAMQAADGSFQIDEQPSIYLTAYALQAMNAFAQSLPSTTQIQKAKTWLVNSQTSGAYASSLDNAVAITALAGTDPSLASAALTALKSAQAPDGSWGADPYVTALAIRAITAQATAGSVGQITGVVLGSVTGTPISGAQVAISGSQSASVTTSANGTFAFIGLAPGSYSLQISKPGYSSAAVSVNVVAGSGTSAGTIRLQVAATAALVTGYVRDAATGTAVAGATVAVSSNGSVTTDAVGHYELAALQSGTVGITLQAAGYTTVSVAANLVAGTVTVFSPALYAGTAPATAELRGTIVDAGTSQPVAGASVTAGSASGITDASGTYVLGGLSTGTVTVQISASGFASSGFQATLAPGTNNVGAVAIARQAASATISGIVTDSATGAAISGATVKLSGSSSSATTAASGAYSVAGVTQTQFAVTVSASGYQTKTISVSLVALADTTVNIALDRPVVSALSIVAIKTDKQTYGPVDVVSLDIDVANTSNSSVPLTMNAFVVDGQASILVNAHTVNATIAASGTTEVDVDLPLAALAAGSYSIAVYGYDAVGNLQVQGTTGLVVNAVAQFGGGIALDPPIAQAGIAQAVHITASMNNLGNSPIPAGNAVLTVTLANADTTVLPLDLVNLLPTGGVAGAPLSLPAGIAFDGAGNLYLANTSQNYNVLKLAPDGTVCVIGTLPSTPFGVNAPADVHVDSQGTVIVMDGAANFYTFQGACVTTPGATGIVSRIATGIKGNTLSFDVEASGALDILVKDTNYKLYHYVANATPTFVTLGNLGNVKGMGAATDGGLNVANNDGTVAHLTAAGASTLLATGLQNVSGAAADAAGNLYVTDFFGGNVVKVTPSGTVTSIGNLSGNTAGAIGVDGNANAFVASSNGSVIWKVHEGSAPVIFSRSLISNVRSMQYDAAGNLYLGGGGGDIVRLDSQDQKTTLAGGLSGVNAIAIAANGDIYTGTDNGKINRTTQAGSTSTFATAAGTVSALAFDGSGGLYYSDNGSGVAVKRLDSNGQLAWTGASIGMSVVDLDIAANGDRVVLSNTQVTLLAADGTGVRVIASSGLSNPHGIAAIGDGTYYVQEDNTLKRVSATGAVSVVASQLPGLAWGVAVHSTGGALVVDYNNHKALLISQGGAVSTLATLGTCAVSRVVSDRTGGMLFGCNSGGGILRVDSAGNVTTLLATQLNNPRVAMDTVGNRVFIRDGSALRIEDMTTKTVTTLDTGFNYSVVESFQVAGNALVGVITNPAQVAAISFQGDVTQVTAGFLMPSSMVWDGARLIFDDGTRLLAMTPNGLATILVANGSVGAIAWRNGALYRASNTVTTLQPGVDTAWRTFLPQTSIWGAIAARGDGAIAVGSSNDGHVQVFDVNGNSLASYAGINSVQAIAGDLAGNVYVANGSPSQIVKIDPSGLRSQVVAYNTFANALAIDASGQPVFPANNGAASAEIFRLEQDGSRTHLGSVPYGVNQMTQVGGAIYVSNGFNTVGKIASGTYTAFAAGLSSPGPVALDANGDLLVPSTDSIIRLHAGAIGLAASGISGARAVTRGTNGDLLVGANGGNIYSVKSDGTVNWISTSILTGDALIAPAYMASAPDGTFGVSFTQHNNTTEVHRFSYQPAQPPAAGGTVVYTKTIPTAAMRVGSGIFQTLDFGTWTPPYGGDFSFALTTPTANGLVTNALHVGPNATGQISASTSLIAPGDSTVPFSVKLTGGDFTTIAHINGSMDGGQSVSPGPTSMGTDASGALYIVQNNVADIRKYVGATSTLFFTDPDGGGYSMVGGVPVDDQQNLYVATRSKPNIILKLSPTASGTATSTTFATLTENVKSLARGQGDVIYAMGSKTLFRITPDGKFTAQATFDGTVDGITIDGRDNVYALMGVDVAAVHPDKTISWAIRRDVNGEPTYETEGGIDIAGDCASNLLISPNRWQLRGPNSNEASWIFQIIQRTGAVGEIVDLFSKYGLSDLDAIAYDRFGGKLLVFDEIRGSVFRLPVTCGGIDADLHLVFPANQPAGSSTVAPKSVVTRPDGKQEYVWGLNDITAYGSSIGLNTTLRGLTLGAKKVPIASDAFLVFRNAFASGDVTLPLAIPTVDVDGQVDVKISTDHTQYAENTDVVTAVQLTNRAAFAETANLRIELTDAQGASVSVLSQQSVTLSASGAATINPLFNTGAYLAGAYQLKATLTDPATGLQIANGVANFDIVPSGVALVSSVSTDKQAYNAVDTVVVTGRVLNASFNVLATDLSLRVSVTGPNSSVMLDNTAAISVLVPQALKDNTYRLALNGAPAGSYTVTESLFERGSLVDTHSVTFSILSTADTGSGLRAAVSATHAANVGDLVTITATLSDLGNAALSGVAITFHVVNPVNGQEVFSASANTNVALGGSLQQVSQSWSTGQAAPGVYIAAVTARLNGGTRDIPLGQDNIKLGTITPFSFIPATNALLGSLVQSAPVTVGGILASAMISVSAGGEYQLDGGAWYGTNGQVMPGQKVSVRVFAGTGYNQTTRATLTIAGYSADFVVTTLNPDVTPDTFNFAPQTNAPVSSLRVSQAATISGIDIPVAISISGGEYSLNGGITWTSAPGMVQPLQSVMVRLTSSATLGTTTTATLTVSNVSAVFSVTTTAQDTMPDAFSFTSLNPVPVSTVETSNEVTISGINVAVPITVSAGSAYSVNGAAFASTPGTISSGDKLKVRQTSSSSFKTTVTTRVSVGDYSTTFESTTEGEDTTPDAMSFKDLLGVALTSQQVSNAVPITGINTTVPVSISGGEYSVNGGAYTNAAGTVKSNDTITLRVTSASTFDTPTVITLTVSQSTATFTVRTKTTANVTASNPSFLTDARILVLLACKVGGLEDADDDPACLSQRQSFLDSYLSGLGIDHLIVTGTEDFRTWLRSGRYDTYWVSGGAKKLLDTLGEEVREASFRGESLITDGVHDQRNSILDDALGMIFKGKPTGITTVTLSGTSVPAGSFDVSGTKPIRAVLTTAIREARFNTGDPAIALNFYGYGPNILFGFDLVGTLAAQSTSPTLHDTLDQLLAIVGVQIQSFVGRDYVPISLELTNGEAVPVDADVVVTLPPGFTYLSSVPPATLNGASVKSHITLAARGSGSLSWVLRSADVAGTNQVSIDIKQTYGTSVVPLIATSATVQITDSGAALLAATTAISSLGVATTTDAKARDAALADVRSAQAAAGVANWVSAIAALADAADQLDGITSVNVDTARRSIDLGLKDVQRKWWWALPQCPAAQCKSN